MLPTNCEINLIFTGSENCVICKVSKATNFVVTDAKHYVPIVTLLTQNNTKIQVNRLFVVSFENNAVRTGRRHRNKKLQYYDWSNKFF